MVKRHQHLGKNSPTLDFFQSKTSHTEKKKPNTGPIFLFLFKRVTHTLVYDLHNITLNIAQTENTALPSKNKLLRNVKKEKCRKKKNKGNVQQPTKVAL